MEQTHELAARVRDVIGNFSTKSKITVTTQAVDLIVAVVIGFRDDPHPEWKSFGESHNRITDELVDALPLLLERTSREFASGREITTFDVVALISRHLSWICPFVCPFPGSR
jgi:hypothetical protein